MANVYTSGDVVTYLHELPIPEHVLDFNCSQVTHHGEVITVEGDASGDQVLTVKFDCGLTRDVLASTVKPCE